MLQVQQTWKPSGSSKNCAMHTEKKTEAKVNLFLHINKTPLPYSQQFYSWTEAENIKNKVRRRNEQARDALGNFPCNAVCALHSLSSRDVETQPWFDSHQKEPHKSPRSEKCAEKRIAWEYLQSDCCQGRFCRSLLRIQLLWITPGRETFSKGRWENNQQSKQGLNTKRPNNLTEQTFGRVFLNFLWWLWDCECGWRWSISPEEIPFQPVICSAMSVCRVFYCAQDSKGLWVLNRVREDWASIFQSVCTAPLIPAVGDQSSTSGAEAHGKFLSKRTWICKELVSWNTPHNHAPHSCISWRQKSCFASFETAKPFLPLIVLRCPEGICPVPLIPSAQVRKP